MYTSDKDKLQHLISKCYQVYHHYEWLLNAYILDFFTENHWMKVPECWKDYLQNIKLEEMSHLLNLNEDLQCKKVLPLSLLTTYAIVKHNHICRKPLISTNKNLILGEDKFKKLFWKHVKVKKRHEIEEMAEFCSHMVTKTNCFFIVDIGSGLGHLSRLLAFGYGLKVCAVDVQNQLIQQARKLDEELKKMAKKNNLDLFLSNDPVHIKMDIQSVNDFYKIIELLEATYGIDRSSLQFGIVGLHPCGDLGANLLKFFNSCNNIRFINIASCCYMKLTTPVHNWSNLDMGFPLSNYCIKKRYNLSYYSRELACHALENYVNRLKKGEYWQLKIHSYRATIELLISRKLPHLKHTQLANVKYTKDLTFEEYCRKALSKVNFKLHISQAEKEEVEEKLKQWKNVVIFYSLRVLLAPVVESLILFDRLLFTIENGAESTLVPLFNPLLSPRNCVLSAQKETR